MEIDILNSSNDVENNALKKSREQIMLGDRHSLNGEFSAASLEYEHALDLAQGESTCPKSLLAEIQAKIAINQSHQTLDKSVLKRFELAVSLFEEAIDYDKAEYANCLNYFGKALQRSKLFSNSIDAYEKALVVALDVTSLKPVDHEQMIKVLKKSLEETAELAKGEKKQILRARVDTILGRQTIITAPCFAKALEALHKEGYAKNFSWDLASTLVSSSDLDEESEEGDWTLLTALRKLTESEHLNQYIDGFFVFVELSNKTDANVLLEKLEQHLEKEIGLKVEDWSGDLFDSMTVIDINKNVTTFVYNGLNSLVTVVNNELEQLKDDKRFFTLESEEDVGVYFLMRTDAQKRLAKLRALPFAD